VMCGGCGCPPSQPRLTIASVTLTPATSRPTCPHTQQRTVHTYEHTDGGEHNCHLGRRGARYHPARWPIARSASLATSHRRYISPAPSTHNGAGELRYAGGVADTSLRRHRHTPTHPPTHAQRERERESSPSSWRTSRCCRATTAVRQRRGVHLTSSDLQQLPLVFAALALRGYMVWRGGGGGSLRWSAAGS
jgi:hypothetical protein